MDLSAHLVQTEAATRNQSRRQIGHTRAIALTSVLYFTAEQGEGAKTTRYMRKCAFGMHVLSDPLDYLIVVKGTELVPAIEDPAT